MLSMNKNKNNELNDKKKILKLFGPGNNNDKKQYPNNLINK